MSNPVSLTEIAAKRIREIINNNDNVIGIRVSVKPKGCMGLSYSLELEYKTEIDPSLDSFLYQDKGVNIYIDKKAQNFLSGTMVDFKDEGLNAEFVFMNPNAKNTCSCGSSFCV